MSESSGLKNKFVYSFFGTSYGSTILFPDLLTFNCQIKSLFKPWGRGGGILSPQYFWYFGAPEEHAAADHNARYETKMDWPTQKVLRIILPITTFPFHIFTSEISLYYYYEFYGVLSNCSVQWQVLAGGHVTFLWKSASKRSLRFRVGI